MPKLAASGGNRAVLQLLLTIYATPHDAPEDTLEFVPSPVSRQNHTLLYSAEVGADTRPVSDLCVPLLAGGLLSGGGIGSAFAALRNYHQAEKNAADGALDLSNAEQDDSIRTNQLAGTPESSVGKQDEGLLVQPAYVLEHETGLKFMPEAAPESIHEANALWNTRGISFRGLDSNCS